MTKNNRISLHNRLVELMKKYVDDGKPRVFFNPTTNTKLNYPCILYREISSKSNRADDRRYLYTKRYEVTVVDKDLDRCIHDDIMDTFPLAYHSNSYIKENLCHYILNINDGE